MQKALRGAHYAPNATEASIMKGATIDAQFDSLMKSLEARRSRLVQDAIAGTAVSFTVRGMPAGQAVRLAKRTAVDMAMCERKRAKTAAAQLHELGQRTKGR